MYDKTKIKNSIYEIQIHKFFSYDLNITTYKIQNALYDINSASDALKC